MSIVKSFCINRTRVSLQRSMKHVDQIVEEETSSHIGEMISKKQILYFHNKGYPICEVSYTKRIFEDNENYTEEKVSVFIIGEIEELVTRNLEEYTEGYTNLSIGYATIIS